MTIRQFSDINRRQRLGLETCKVVPNSRTKMGAELLAHVSEYSRLT
uniref:Uncharacterized protein n=1 Tax=Arundo donax TaxID=35708 RepID=A0A0A8XP71_ARUDO